MKTVYIASPFTHEDPNVQEDRFFDVTCVAADLTEKFGYAFILPITQSHMMSKANPKLDGKFDFWEKIDLTFVSKSDEVWVVMLDGWENSVGVSREIEFAKSNNIPVRYIDPAEYLCNSWNNML